MLYYGDMQVRYYPLIDKIMTRLRLRDQDDRLKTYSDHSFLKPFITIAREPGSGGAPIAQAVADKLGFTLLDEQIVDEIARSTKKRKAIIHEVDEKSRDRISDMVQSLFNPEYVDDVKYLVELAKIILAYASKGNVVILGRGANFITPFATGLHVNITAPYEVRVKRAMDFEGHNRARAKKVIADIEQERESFVKQYLRRDLATRNAYDLTLNTTYFQVDEARDIILEAFYKKFSRSVKYGQTFTPQPLT